ncbi:MAG: hypothetical protein PVJ21_13800 [Anaerolineales bacterium]|jgi:hypothetical protein
MKRNNWILGLMLFLTTAILPGCDRLQPKTPVPGIDSPIQTENIQVKIIDAGIRNSYSVHYIMHYPKTGAVFCMVTAQLEGFEKPQNALAWGQENLKLLQADRTFELAYAHWELRGEGIQYKSGEDFQYQYVFIYSVPEDIDEASLSVQVSNTDLVALEALMQERLTAKSDLNRDDDNPEAQTDDLFSTMSGGSKNVSDAYHTTVSGGYLNEASVAYASVGGGRENLATDLYATVSGGYANQASGRDSTVGGGSRNSAENHHATVSGGIRNRASASDATVGGGSYNLASDTYATVSGGTQNEASGSGAVVSGGAGNLASNNQSTVGGGLGNQSNGAYATISGGQGNLASGDYSVISGGLLNQALSEYSFAGGHRAIVSKDHPGAFLFADSVEADFLSERADEFGVRATGGVRFVTGVDGDGDPITGVSLAPGSGSWSSTSDRGMKENFVEVNQLQILERVVDLPISEWNYKSQEASIRHIGPMSQDFFAAFGTGEDKFHISSVDAGGISLAAIQGLYQLIEEKDSRIETLESRLERIERLNIFIVCSMIFFFLISIFHKAQMTSVWRLLRGNKKRKRPDAH